MINYREIKGRPYWGMSKDDLSIFAELIWLLKHTPPPIGFNRKPLTLKQQNMIEDFFQRINYGEDYAKQLNTKNGQ